MQPVRTWPEYFNTLTGTLALIEKLEAFTRGEETQESLQAWARAVWGNDGTQLGPLRANAMATGILVNVMNGNERENGAEEQSRAMLRTEDAVQYLLNLRHGVPWSAPRPIAAVVGTMGDLARRVKVEPVRHVIDGLGWFEILFCASPGTGRVFVIRNAVSTYAKEGVYHPMISTQVQGNAQECLLDMMETLAIDRSDLSWLADEFTGVELPEWAVWRQDDNGVREELGTFTAYRKAVAAIAELEARTHKQTYWIEARARFPEL
jgi:hypothetical protein